MTTTPALAMSELEPVSDSPADYRMGASDELWLTNATPVQRFEANVEAIRCAKGLASGRPVTDADRLVMARYSGMGDSAFNDAFPHSHSSKPNRKLTALGAELQALLTPEEYSSMGRSRLNAHYTSPDVIRAMWSGLERLGIGVRSHLRVLEPSAGNGRFVSMMPDHLREKSSLSLIELDKLTGAMLGHLFPSASVFVTGFERIDVEHPGAVPDDSQDVVISNVPFGAIKVADPAYLAHPSLTASVHNYFFVKGLAKARPGGIVAFITSHYTFDAASSDREDFRRYLAHRATLLGAIRLPSGTFGDTAVTTDVVFFQKNGTVVDIDSRSDAASLDGGPEWVHSDLLTFEGQREPIDVHVNRYFLSHPDMALGEHGVSTHTTDGVEGYVLLPGETSALELLGPAVNMLPENVVSDEGTVAGAATLAAALPTEGSFVEGTDGVLRVVAHGELRVAGRYVKRGKSREWTAYAASEVARIRAMLSIHDLGRAVLDLQRAGEAPLRVSLAQTALRREYHAFVRDSGPLHSRANRALMRSDARSYWLQALERWSEALEQRFSGSNAKRKVTSTELALLRGDIFSKTVQSPDPPMRRVASVSDALAVVLNDVGSLDLLRMGALLGRPWEDVAAELHKAGMIYRNPTAVGARGEGHWETADEYLSGKVRLKLEDAQIAARLDESYLVNVEALLKVQPAPIEPGDIDVRLGTAWIPEDDVNDFVRELLYKDEPQYQRDETFKFVAGSDVSKWVPVGTCYQHHWRIDYSKLTEYGTNRIGPLELVEHGLNGKQVRIMDDVGSPGEPKYVLNEEATRAANGKLRSLKMAFVSWLWSDAERTVRLATYYNETYNDTVLRRFDGSHLTFVNGNPNIRLRPHQKDVVWRGLQEPSVLMAHEVGYGKSLSMAALAMEMRRLGLARKVAIVVPNHLVGQMAGEFYKMYPQANLLVPSKADYDADSRAALMARIAGGDWDAVIFAQSQFKLLGVHPRTSVRFLERGMAELEQLIDTYPGEQNGRTFKQLKKRLTNEQAELQRAQDRLDQWQDRKGVLTYDDLGIDALFVDECFVYETPILTDRGWLPIGEVVENRLPVKVLSVNLETGAREWKPIVRWLPRGERDDLVRVEFEGGTFVCTPEHKIWTEERGYVRADHLAGGETLLRVREQVQADVLPFEGRATMDGDVQQQVWRDHETARADGHKGVCAMLPGVRVQVDGEGARCEASVLRQPLCGRVAHGAVGAAGDNAGGIDKGQGESDCEFEGAAQSEGGRSITAALAGPCISSSGRSGTARPNVSGSGWQWGGNGATVDARGGNAFADRASDSDGASARPVSESAELLQGRSGGPVTDACRGSRWGYASPTEVEVPGSPEDFGTERARVVRVTVLEPRSADGFVVGGREDRRVYDIEVADNHNFFAAGALVSNCQSFKNLAFFTHRARIRGLPNAKSARAFDMHLKTRMLLEERGRGLVFATGTPISNTIAELWTMLRYLAPSMIEDLGIASFDAWASVFGDTIEKMEQTLTGEWKVITRFARFGNAPELSKIFQSVADIRMAEDSPEMEATKPKLRQGRRIPIKSFQLDWHKSYAKSLAERAANLSGKPDKGGDNMLLITHDARLASLCPSMVGGPVHPSGKIPMLVDNVARIWREEERDRGTQLVFLDLGTPKSSEVDKSLLPAELKMRLNAARVEAGDAWDVADEDVVIRDYYLSHDSDSPDDHLRADDVYERIRQRLIVAGVPSAEIAFIHQAKDDKARKVLFEAVNSGLVRVLIGSTEKMGAGTNVQQRVCALHHVDTPWRPSDLEQREGRMVRPGNWLYGPPCDEFGTPLTDSEGKPRVGRGVTIYQYVTEWPFDAYLWSTLLAKMRAIKSMMRRNVSGRSVVDCDEHILDLEELEALASGDPMALKRKVVQEELRQLAAEERDHINLQTSTAYNVKVAQSSLGQFQEELPQIREDLALLEAQPEGFSIEIGGQTFTKRGEVYQRLVDEVVRAMGESRSSSGYRPVQVGMYKGFVLEVRSTRDDMLVLRLRNPEHALPDSWSGPMPVVYKVDVWERDINVQGLLARVENLVHQVASLLFSTERGIIDLEKRIVAAKAFASKPYANGRRLQQLRDGLDMMERRMAGEKLKDADGQVILDGDGNPLPIFTDEEIDLALEVSADTATVFESVDDVPVFDDLGVAREPETMLPGAREEPVAEVAAVLTLAAEPEVTEPEVVLSEELGGEVAMTLDEAPVVPVPVVAVPTVYAPHPMFEGTAHAPRKTKRAQKEVMAGQLSFF